MDKVFFCFVLFLCVALNGDVSCKKHRTVKAGDKIVGGDNATIQQFPYQVHLNVVTPRGFAACGGSILSSQYILTAAHCLKNRPSRVYIKAGSTYINSGGSVYSTSLYTLHPQYNAKTKNYDVAVLELTKPMKLDGTNTRAIKLPPANTDIPVGTNIIVTGWGRTQENGQPSNNLMAVRVQTVATSECQKGYNTTITSKMFCAGVPEGGKDACQGDSGGPAVSESSGLQLGISSFGRGCARAGYPGVYTNVSSVRKFIKQQTGI